MATPLPGRANRNFSPARPGIKHATLQVENRFDFRSLQGITLTWRLLCNGTAMESGSILLKAAARTTETVPLSFTLPDDAGTDVFALELRCAEGAADSFHERSLRLDTLPSNTTRIGLLASQSPAAPLELDESAAEIRITHPGFSLSMTRATGEITLRDPADRVLATAWPTPLTAWLGPASAKEPVFQPYFHSYDQ